MEEHVVDTGGKHEIDIGFALRERGAEVLGQPGQRLGRDIGLARDMGTRGGIFEHGEIGIVFLGHRVAAQPLNLKVGNTEALTLRNIDRSIEVDEITGRAMGLVAGDATLLVGPGGPLLGKILFEKLGDCFAIIGYETSPGTQRSTVLNSSRWFSSL